MSKKMNFVCTRVFNARTLLKAN